MELRHHIDSISRRHELYAYLAGKISGRKNASSSYESNVVKTTVLEASAVPDGPVTPEYVKNLFSTEERPAEVVQLEEANFFRVTRQGKSDERPVIWVDATANPRFWLSHSVSSAKILRPWHSQVIRTNPLLDRAWLWPQMLEEIQSWGSSRGFHVAYEGREFSDIVKSEMPLWSQQVMAGRKTAEVYSQMKELYRGSIVLSRVYFTEETDGETPSLIQDIGKYGNLNARGTDALTHIRTANKVRKRYAQAIQAFEACALRWTREEGGIRLKGSPIHLRPTGPFRYPVESLFSSVFDGKKPFRLKGLITRKARNWIEGDVLDIHTGSLFSVSLSPEFLSITLKPNTCGNVVARFYTNFQHYFGSEFQLTLDDGEPLSW